MLINWRFQPQTEIATLRQKQSVFRLPRIEEREQMTAGMVSIIGDLAFLAVGSRRSPNASNGSVPKTRLELSVSGIRGVIEHARGY